jgi:hypothetical protein
MDKYLTRPTFRDPGNLELKTFYDIVTIDDLWLWHYEVLKPPKIESKTSKTPNSNRHCRQGSAMLVIETGAHSPNI